MLEDQPGVTYSLPDAGQSLGPAVASANICRYLNATTSRGPMEHLQQQLVSTKGKVAVEIVELLSGKAVPGKVRMGCPGLIACAWGLRFRLHCML